MKQTKPTPEKILKTLIYNPSYKELGDSLGIHKQSIYRPMKKIPKKDKDKVRAEREQRIRAIMNEKDGNK
jgi:hypothetical protein